MQKVQILENKLRRLKLQLQFCSIASIDYVLMDIERTEKLIAKAKYELQ